MVICVEYLIHYERNLIEVRVDVDMRDNITVNASNAAFELRYALMYDGWEEASIWLNSIKSILYVKPESALYLLERIFNEGKILHERECWE